MIITPEKLKKWLDNDKNFTLLDTRPKNQILLFPQVAYQWGAMIMFEMFSLNLG